MRLKIKSKISLEGSFIDYFLPVFYVLAFYDMKISSLGIIIMYIHTFYRVLINGRRAIMIPKWLFLLDIYILITQFFIFEVYGGMNSSRLFNILTAILMLIVLVFNLDILNKKVFLRNYICIAMIASFLIIIQNIQINIFNQEVHQIMLLPMEVSDEWYSVGIRPTSIFPEPQVYATYILPLVIILLEKKEKALVVFFSLSICLSTSSLGILALLFIFLYYFCLNDLKIRKKAFILLGLILVIFIMLKIPFFNYSMNKILETDFTNNVRLTRGFNVFTKLDLPQMIFGIGYNNFGYFLDQNYLIMNDTISHVMKNPAYITSIYETLVYFGLIGFGIYGIFFISFLKQKKFRVLILLLFVLSFAQTILFNGSWLFYLIIYFNYTKKNNNNFITVKL